MFSFFLNPSIHNADESNNDVQGNKFRFKLYKGLKFIPDIPGNIGDHLEEVSSLVLRSDDVLLCTYPKSGTHWVYNIIRTKNTQYRGTPHMIDFHSPSELKNLESPRTIHTHLTYPLIPKMAKLGQVKIVHVLRNPKDTITSHYEFCKGDKTAIYEGDFNGFLDFCLSDEFAGYGGNWFSYVRGWQNAKHSNKDLQILSLQYEEIKQNTYGTILKLVDFLQLERSESFTRDVEKAVQFEQMRKEHETDAGKTEIWKDNRKDGRLPIYRKGCVGNWKSYFSVAQSERFDALYDKYMKEHGIDLSYQ